MSLWTDDEVKVLSERYAIGRWFREHADAEDFYFPEKNFLKDGYMPPGGYVKDLSVLFYEGRMHLFHIDGRPGEICIAPGNEISFGHASTDDFCRWIRHGMPLAVGEREWENDHIWAPYIYKHENLYYMFYMGRGRNGDTFISYATSDDLEHWNRWTAGPIRCAVGRDPFVFNDGDRIILLYTALGGARIGACASPDMTEWTALQDVLSIRSGSSAGAAESCSLHLLDNRYVLWFNDYRKFRPDVNKGWKLADFRARYVFSDDPFHFNPDEICEFEFITSNPDATPGPEIEADKPTPLSIERIAGKGHVWFVCYFRWHVDRNRLFFGTIDWSASPAVINEINDEDALKIALRRTGIKQPLE